MGTDYSVADQQRAKQIRGEEYAFINHERHRRWQYAWFDDRRRHHDDAAGKTNEAHFDKERITIGKASRRLLDEIRFEVRGEKRFPRILIWRQSIQCSI